MEFCSVRRLNVAAAHFDATVLKRQSVGEGGMPMRPEFGFWRELELMKLPETLVVEPCDPGLPSPQRFSPRSLQCHELEPQNLVFGVRGCGFCGVTRKEQMGNSSGLRARRRRREISLDLSSE